MQSSARSPGNAKLSETDEASRQTIKLLRVRPSETTSLPIVMLVVVLVEYDKPPATSIDVTTAHR